MCPSIPSFNIHLKQASGYLNFWRLARLNSLPPGAQMPHPRGGFDTFFFFSKRKNLQAWLSSHWPNFTLRARTMDKYPWVAWWTGCWKFELIGALRRNGLSWSISKTANWTTHIYLSSLLHSVCFLVSSSLIQQQFSLPSIYSANLLNTLITDITSHGYESDLRSNVHYLGSSEKKAWKKFRPVRDLNPWPLRYRCSALPTELMSQLTSHINQPTNK